MASEWGHRIEEVGVAEGDVLGARRYQLVDVGEHDFGLDETQSPAVDGCDRAVLTAVSTAATGLDITGHAIPIPIAQVGVEAERREARSVRDHEVVSREEWPRTDAGPASGAAGAARQAVGEGNQGRLVLAADDVVDESPLGQSVVEQRRVEPVAGDRHRGAELADALGYREPEAGGRVHRHREGDQVHSLEIDLRGLDGEVQGGDLVPGGAQHGGGAGDPERLVAELVGRDQEDSDLGTYGRREGGGAGAHRVGPAATSW